MRMHATHATRARRQRAKKKNTHTHTIKHTLHAYECMHAYTRFSSLHAFFFTRMRMRTRRGRDGTHLEQFLFPAHEELLPLGEPRLERFESHLQVGHLSVGLLHLPRKTAASSVRQGCVNGGFVVFGLGWVCGLDSFVRYGGGKKMLLEGIRTHAQARTQATQAHSRHNESAPRIHTSLHTHTHTRHCTRKPCIPKTHCHMHSHAFTCIRMHTHAIRTVP